MEKQWHISSPWKDCMLHRKLESIVKRSWSQQWTQCLMGWHFFSKNIFLHGSVWKYYYFLLVPVSWLFSPPCWESIRILGSISTAIQVVPGVKYGYLLWCTCHNRRLVWSRPNAASFWVSTEEAYKRDNFTYILTIEFLILTLFIFYTSIYLNN